MIFFLILKYFLEYENFCSIPWFSSNSWTCYKSAKYFQTSEYFFPIPWTILNFMNCFQILELFWIHELFLQFFYFNFMKFLKMFFLPNSWLFRNPQIFLKSVILRQREQKSSECFLAQTTYIFLGNANDLHMGERKDEYNEGSLKELKPRTIRSVRQGRLPSTTVADEGLSIHGLFYWGKKDEIPRPTWWDFVGLHLTAGLNIYN